jgi:hypothetical protein
MSKRIYSPNFHSQLTFAKGSGVPNIDVTTDMRMQLRAIAYFLGKKGMYAPIVKMFVAEGIKRFVDNLPPAKLKEYNEIMDNVRLQEIGMPGDQEQGEKP